jgi:RNA polymerase sigma factor (sigma-70 family)
MPRAVSGISIKAVEGDRKQEGELWQEAVAFVSDRNRRKIIGKMARKFSIYSPYDIGDYLREAAIVAFEAMKLSREKGESARQEGYFWVMLKHAFSDLSTNPAQQDVVPGEDAGPLACVFEPYSEEWDDEGTIRPTGSHVQTTPQVRAMQREELETLYFKKNMRSALEAMTEREREVWTMIFDGKSTREIAEKLGTTRQNVEKLRDRGILKIAQLASNESGSRHVPTGEKERKPKCSNDEYSG